MPELSTDRFIRQATLKHADKFDYSQVVYLNNYTPIVVGCPTHGLMRISPSTHIKGHGCAKCAHLSTVTKLKKTTAQFIAEARQVHGTKYDYSEVQYLNAHAKVSITCHIHGIFKQDPAKHLAGSECPNCGYLKTSQKSLEKRRARFLQQAAEVHGGKYDYSAVVYTDNYADVAIRCPSHGIFKQRPSHHLDGSGCNQCAIIKTTIARTKSQADFIFGAREVHGTKYDYSFVEYKGSFKKITIICPKHGKFLQTADHHIRGSGCSKCMPRVSKGETQFLDYLNIPYYDRQVFISKHRFHVDGLDAQNRIVYEFLGDYYHGIIIQLPASLMRYLVIFFTVKPCRVSMARFSKLKEMGFAVRYVWETDWIKFQKSKTANPVISEH